MKNKTLNKGGNLDELMLRKRLKKLFTNEELKAAAKPIKRKTEEPENTIYQQRPYKTTIPKVKKSNVVQVNEKSIEIKQNQTNNVAKKKKNKNQKKSTLERQQEPQVSSGKPSKISVKKQNKKPINKVSNNNDFSKVKSNKPKKRKDTLPTKNTTKLKNQKKTPAKKQSKEKSNEQIQDSQPTMNGKGVLKSKKRRITTPTVVRPKKVKHEPMIVSKIHKDAEAQRTAHSMYESDSTDDTDYKENSDDVDYYSEDDDSFSADDDQDFSDYEYIGSSEQESFTDYDDDIQYCEADSDSYNFDDVSDDEDYQLPKNVLEDLIIHKGTAEKRALTANDKVEFDSDDEEAQIVEVSNESVKTIIQAEAYHMEQLQKLNDAPFSCNIRARQSDESGSNGDRNSETSECPQLVPIVDEDGFQLYNPESDSCCSESSYSSVISSDVSSFIEEDINSKYLPTAEFSDIEEEELQMDAVVINAENCDYQSVSAESAVSQEEHIEQLPSERLAQVSNVTSDIDAELVTATVMETRSSLEVTSPKKASNNVTSDIDAEVSTATVMEASNSLEVTSAEEASNNPSYGMDAKLATATVMEASSSLEITSAEEASNDVDRDANVTIELPIVSTEKSKKAAKKSRKTEKFSSIFCNAFDSNHVLVLLKESIYLYGTMCMTLVAGAVEVYGYSPVIGEELEILSPRGCSSVSIAAVPNHTTNVSLNEELERLEAYFSMKDLQRIFAEFEEGCDAVLLLRRNVERKKLINFFKKYMHENVFPNMNSIHIERPLYASEYLLNCVINLASEKALYVPPQWSALQFTAQSKVMIVGGKAVGKSTLLRYLINRHLNKFQKVLLIDLDIGQSEIFVPQTVSCTVMTQPLLGPGFFLNRQPDKAYMLGQCNILLCAHQYLRTVKQLLHYCHANEEFSQMPWFINTMGYNKGFGIELISMIAQLLKPTDLVQLQSNNAINNFDAILAPQVLATAPRNVYMSEEFTPSQENVVELKYRLHVLNTAIPQASRYQREWNMSPKDFRYAIFLSRLSEALQGNAEMLTDCKPLSASLNDLKLVNMHLDENETTVEEVAQATEVNLVFLCQRENESNKTEALQCFGIGIVRAIDYYLKELYLLPAMPFSRLKSVNCLALGEMPLPASLFTNQGSKVRSEAPFVHNTIDANASRSVKQIPHRPPQFLTGKHRNVLTE